MASSDQQERYWPPDPALSRAVLVGFALARGPNACPLRTGIWLVTLLALLFRRVVPVPMSHRDGRQDAERDGPYQPTLPRSNTRCMPGVAVQKPRPSAWQSKSDGCSCVGGGPESRNSPLSLTSVHDTHRHCSFFIRDTDQPKPSCRIVSLQLHYSL